MVISLRGGILLMVLGTGLALPGAAAASINRHCVGYLGARVVNGVDEHGKPFTQHDAHGLAGVVLEGRGTCKNKLKANDCRRQARDLIVKCGSDLWGQRWSKTIPASCAAAPSGGRPYGRIKSWGAEGLSPPVRNKLTGDVKRAVEVSACCVLYPKARSLNFAVYLSSHGDNGCSSKRNLENLYKADCSKLRAQGLCGAPRRARP